MNMKFIRQLLKTFRKNRFVVEGRPVRVEVAGKFFIGIFHGYLVEQRQGVPYYTQAMVELPDGTLHYFPPDRLQFSDRIQTVFQLQQAYQSEPSEQLTTADFSLKHWRRRYWKRFRF